MRQSECLQWFCKHQKKTDLRVVIYFYLKSEIKTELDFMHERHERWRQGPKTAVTPDMIEEVYHILLDDGRVRVREGAT